MKVGTGGTASELAIHLDGVICTLGDKVALDIDRLNIAIGERVAIVGHQESHDYKSLILLMFLITRTLHYSLHYTHRQSLAMDEVRAGAC